MKEQYNRYFEKVVSLKSDEELYQAVLNSGKAVNMKNEKQTKKRISKSVVIPVAAAVAVAVGSVSVAAVYKRNVDKEYADALAVDNAVFPQKYYDKDGNPADLREKTASDGTVEKLSFELNKVFDFDDFSLEFTDVISDGSTVYVMYNAIGNVKGWQNVQGYSLNANPVDMPEGVTSSGKLLRGNFSVVDGKWVYSSSIAFKGAEKCGDTLRVMLEDLHDTHYEKTYDLNVELEIPLDKDNVTMNCSESIGVPSAPEVKLAEWGNWQLKNITVKPLGLTFDLSTDGEAPYPQVAKIFMPKIPVKINFEDGSTLDMTEFSGGSQGIDQEAKTMVITKDINYPINVDEVKSVQFANRVVDMDGNVTTVNTPELVAKYKGENFVYHPEDGTLENIPEDVP